MKYVLIFLLFPLVGHSQTADRYLCEGRPLILSTPDTLNSHSWYRDSVFVITVHGQTYTDANPLPGLHFYQIQSTDTLGCSSILSDPFRVFVYPGLNPVITTPLTSVCAVPGNAVTLTVSVNSDYTINYQWRRNDIPIAGAVSTAYNVSESTPGVYIYTVDVTYTNSTGCVFSATKQITAVGAPNRPTIQ